MEEVEPFARKVPQPQVHLTADAAKESQAACVRERIAPDAKPVEPLLGGEAAGVPGQDRHLVAGGGLRARQAVDEAFRAAKGVRKHVGRDVQDLHGAESAACASSSARRGATKRTE